MTPHARPLLALIAALTAVPALAQDAFTLRILHFNDFHSRIEPINRFDSACSEKDDAEGKCFGGMARLATAVAEARAAAGNQPLLLLDAGDVFQGSLFYTTYKGLAEAELFAGLGIDAMMLGNHEFDDGPAALAAYLDKTAYPVLAGNVDVSAEPLLAGRLPTHRVLEIGGERVGIIGALASDTAETSSPGPNVRFGDEIAHLAAAAAALQAEGVNKIIALTHVGVEHDLRIAAAVPGIDVVIGGHSHTIMSNSIEGATPYPLSAPGAGGVAVPVAQAGAYGKFLGDLSVTFDAAGVVTAAVGDTRLLDASVAEDPAIKARVAELAGPLQALREKVIGEATAPIDGDRANCRARECAMGALVAEAMLDRVKGQGVRIAIQNGGGLRASIDGGAVTMGAVLTVLPFQNTLATFTLTGAEVVEALENGLSQVEEGAGRFPQVAGIRYVWDPKAPAGARVVSVTLEGPDGAAPLDLAARYGVVSNNFMRAGGDGYAVFRDKGLDGYDYGPNLEDVVAAFIADRTPYAPALPGRIVEKAAP